MKNYPPLTHLQNRNQNHPGHSRIPPIPLEGQKANHGGKKNTRGYLNMLTASCYIVRYENIQEVKEANEGTFLKKPINT